MSLKYRKYIEGDDYFINEMYKQITDINRTKRKYEWEWLNTWDGRGDIHLLFEEPQKSNQNPLAAQYSLIPVPFSCFGSLYLAGKTENCMCNPRYRKKSIYFKHEKKSFEEAKNRFQLFYTTAGGVSSWAVANIRKKLGYIPFDSWSSYFYCLDPKTLKKFIAYRMKGVKKGSWIFKFIITSCTYLVAFYCDFRTVIKSKRFYGEVVDRNFIDLLEIEQLWNRNKKIYGMSVDRNTKFLQWRLVENPNLNYKFLLLRKCGTLIGCAVFYKDKFGIMNIEDIIADKKSVLVLDQLLDSLFLFAWKEKYKGIHCKTLMGNMWLRKSFLKKGFVDIMAYAVNEIFSKHKKRFLVFLPDDLKYNKNCLRKKNWYITQIAAEGREI